MNPSNIKLVFRLGVYLILFTIGGKPFVMIIVHGEIVDISEYGHEAIRMHRNRHQRNPSKFAAVCYLFWTHVFGRGWACVNLREL